MTRQIQPALGRIPTGVWVLGFVSMLMDISSEMIHSLLPLFMVQVLGTSMVAVGLIEGLAESMALIGIRGDGARWPRLAAHPGSP